MKTVIMYGASDMFVTLHNNIYALTTDKDEALDFGNPEKGFYNTICTIDTVLSRRMTGYKCGLLKVMTIN